MDLPSGRNHADYVDDSGYYAIVPYLMDHAVMFPSLSNVVVGQICPHILAESDCENLFNQLGFIAETRRNPAGRRDYEQLVMLKHRLGCIYCHPPDVKALYI